MAVAFGQLGLTPDTFWSMTPREFFNAWSGYNQGLRNDVEIKKQEIMATRNLLYGSARWHAAATARSNTQAQAIARHRFDWESATPGKPMTYTQIAKSLKSFNASRKN